MADRPCGCADAPLARWRAAARARGCGRLPGRPGGRASRSQRHRRAHAAADAVLAVARRRDLLLPGQRQGRPVTGRSCGSWSPPSRSSTTSITRSRRALNNLALPSRECAPRSRSGCSDSSSRFRRRDRPRPRGSSSTRPRDRRRTSSPRRRRHELPQPDPRPGECADLRIRVALAGGAVGPTGLGQDAQYRLDIDNDGNEAATGVRLELATTKAALTFGVGALACTGPKLDLTCALPPIAPGAVRSVGSPRARRSPTTMRSPSRSPPSSPTATRARTPRRASSRSSRARASARGATTFSTARRATTGSARSPVATRSTEARGTTTSTRGTARTSSPAAPVAT